MGKRQFQKAPLYILDDSKYAYEKYKSNVHGRCSSALNLSQYLLAQSQQWKQQTNV